MVRGWGEVCERFASLFYTTRPDFFPQGLISFDALLNLCAARRALSANDWGEARKKALSCLKSQDKWLASRALATSVGGFCHADLFRLLFSLQRAMPELANVVNDRSRSVKK